MHLGVSLRNFGLIVRFASSWFVVDLCQLHTKIVVDVLIIIIIICFGLSVCSVTLRNDYNIVL